MTFAWRSPLLSPSLVLICVGLAGCGVGSSQNPPTIPKHSPTGGSSGSTPPTVDAGSLGTVDAGPLQTTSNKVDLLLMIDNSASMGDKQEYLQAALPDLVSRLVTPYCVDPSNPIQVLGVSGSDGTCASGVPEFPPVRDMHIGVVSSSLGPRLSDRVGNGNGIVCSAATTVTVGGNTLNAHNDDRAELLTTSGVPAAPIPAAQPSGFLAWYPTPAADGGSAPVDPAISDPAVLAADFQDLVGGAGQYGCGIESQLESWYRFLIQPDPYQELTVNAKGAAEWAGVDRAILRQRHDFLRPDSIVAIVDLTDENDSEIDVRSIDGQGYFFMSTEFFPVHGTAICADYPDDPTCTICKLGDPSCKEYNTTNDWGYDINLRHVHMKEKYGIDPQFPITRYVNGLTSPVVPDRTGEYPAGAGDYVGTNDCTNPLFAASLPDGTSTDAATLCDLTPGTRSPSMVFFTHIGGVPHQLLHFDPKDPPASRLTDSDWVKILGRDPLHHDTAGIDPHMIESYAPRAGLPDPSQPNGTDPISGREWITDVGAHVDLPVDLEYACTFPLAAPRDCSVKDNHFACDCSSTTLTKEQTSPLCDAVTPTMQLSAKAYPTIRELLLTKLLGPQGVVASICPIDVADSPAKDDPLYGYRPAVTGLVNQMKPALGAK